MHNDDNNIDFARLSKLQTQPLEGAVDHVYKYNV